MGSSTPDTRSRRAAAAIARIIRAGESLTRAKIELHRAMDAMSGEEKTAFHQRTGYRLAYDLIDDLNC